MGKSLELTPVLIALWASIAQKWGEQPKGQRVSAMSALMDDMEQDQEPRPSHHVCYALSGPEIPPVVPQISKPVSSVFPENI